VYNGGEEVKAFRDPVHNLIRFDKNEEKLLLDLIDSREFQRLRYIRQLGLSSFTYIGAEHTRFAHSLGVVHLMKRIIDQFANNRRLSCTEDFKDIEEIIEHRVLVLVAALLHDVGHGPFSHVLEKTTGIKHEYWTERIIRSEKTEINQILEGYKSGFAENVAKVIERIHSCQAVVKLLSSQLDADRLDYLLRDSVMTGAGYGSFDLEWLLHCLRLGKVNGTVEVGLDLNKGLSIAEDFVMARYYMYKHVYFHKTTRCAEKMIDKVFERALELQGQISLPPALEVILKNNNEDVLDSYLSLTDNTIWYFINIWSTVDDLVLSMLCRGLLHRQLYKMVTAVELDNWERQDQLNELAKSEGIHRKYLFLMDRPSSSVYKDTYLLTKLKDAEGKGENEATEQIFLFDKKGEPHELSTVSSIINTIRNNKVSEKMMFVPARLKKHFV